MKAKLILTILIVGAGFNLNSIAQIVYNDADEHYLTQYQLAQEFKAKEMSKEMEDKILKSIPQEIRNKLDEIKKLDKNRYYNLLRSRFPFGLTRVGEDSKLFEAYGLANAGEKMRKEKELEIDAELLSLRLKNAESGSQQKIKNELSDKLSELFEIKETQKQKEVEQLEKRLQELKESLKYRKQNKNEIVQRRIQELMGDSKYLRWE